MAVGLACAVLGVLIELGLDQVVAVSPWLIVSLVAGMLAAILGGPSGGLVAAVIGTLAQFLVIPVWVPAVAGIDRVGQQVHVGTAILALAVGLWIRNLILRPHDGDGAAGRPDREPAPREAELEIVAAALRDFAAARTSAQVADALARHAAALSGAAGAIVYLGRDGNDGLLPLGRHGATDPTAPERLASRRLASATGDDTNTRARALTGDRGGATVAIGTAAGIADSATAGIADSTPVVEYPIRSNTDSFGVLRLHGVRAGPGPRPATLVQVLLQIASDALDRSHLRTTRRVAEAEAAGAVGRVAILARLAAELVGGSTIDEVGQTLVDLVVDDLGAGFAVVHVPDPSSGAFRLVHGRGYPAGLIAREATIPVDASLPVARAAANRTIVEVVGEDGWRAAFPTASNVPAITGVRVITAIPMHAAAAVQGVLTIGWRTPADRARADRDLLGIAADQGAQALERALLHAHDEDARRFQEAFIGVVSHELRTPITTIVAGSRLLRRRLDGDPRAAELSDDIAIEADRLTRIVDDLLVLSRLERRHLTIGDEPVHLDHLVARIVRSESARWPEHRLAVQPSSGSHVVVGDETYVEQVLRNLISNAAKYSPIGSLVELVITDVPDGDVHVGVLDEGPGVLPAEVEELFSLFYRSPTTAASAAGAGIGLFVSRRLVAEMGGRMWATPRPGGGSEFGFSLGRYPADEADLDDPLAGPAPAASA